MKSCWILGLVCWGAATLATAEAAPKSYIRVEVASVRSAPKDSAEQVTQGLLGDEVQLLEERGDWIKVYVRPQYRTENGYPGWTHKEWVVKQAPPEGPGAVVVKVPEALLRDKPDGKARVLQRAGLGSQLTLAEPLPSQGWVSLWVPGQKQPLFAPAQQFEPPPAQALEDGRPIVETAAQLKGTPYLWGGMTAQGIDCSGFTYTAYRVHGITIPRDADQQFQIGTAVKVEELQPGDLLFFGDSASEITHVGMYMWQGKFIHASGSLGGVTVTRFDHPKYQAIFQGARRILGSAKTVP